jgi:hypothetical protein
MANTKQAPKPESTVADALDKISELAGQAPVYEAHGQIGSFVVKLQALIADAKAAL